ncbi:hypothetical protein [Spongiivirga citrea]|uniref:Uncharacterized protein n=1 Tax=Spongiivirga citrea TaxID=1481457 RepID=A0A6M0CFE9_9FLAO|nr:hypothetical protein [Spongiivirga citrea]NER16511.1 hypothetical protein [Spongiivirga citrea]
MNKKYKLLLLGLLIDGIGLLSSSWVFPVIGDFTDIVWAPLTGYLMMKMYKGRTGKVAGTISVVEELLPGLDVIPTFTLTWLYTYVFSTKTEGSKAKKLDK